MDRTTQATIATIAASMLSIGLLSNNLTTALAHGGVLLLPLGVIAFPEVLDRAMRYSQSGYSHGGEGPAPSWVIRLAGWLLLAALSFAGHYQVLALP